MMLREKMTKVCQAALLSLLVVFSFGATGEICGVFFERTDAVFGNKFPDNQPKDIRAVVKRIENQEVDVGTPKNSADTPVAVLVVKGAPRAVIGMDLKSEKQLWRIEVAVNSEITLAGDLMFFKSGNSVVVYNILTGKKRWDYPLEAGWDYFGADANDKWAALSIGVGGDEPGGYANSKLITLNASNGLLQWEHSGGSGILGNPLVVGDMVFAPWDRQKIVVIDIPNEEEICRVRAEDFPINFMKRGGNGVYYGASATKDAMSSLYRFNESSANGRREGVTVFLPKLDPVPGIAHFSRDTFQRSSGGRDTEEKIRFHWTPQNAPNSKIAFDSNQFYLHYWRYIIAFDAETSTVNWTFISPVILESVKALAGGSLIAAGTDNRLMVIDAKTGKETWSVDVGEEILTAEFDADGFAPSVGEAKAEDPEVGLLRLILDNDNRMLPIRAYATHLLAKIPKPVITRDLLKIYADANTPKMLKKAVVRAVETRTVGAEYMVDALDTSYDYIEKTSSPPMKVIAPTLINMKAKDSVPKLVKHFMNHETPLDSLPYILAAIYKLGDKSVVDSLKQFLTLYHADSSFIKHEQVLASAAHTLLKFDERAQAEKFILGLREDPQTLIDFKIMLKKVLDPKKAAQEEAARRAREEAERLAKAKAEQLAKEAAIVPQTLSRDQIHNTIKSNQELFRPCIQDALKKSPTLETIRMRFVLDGDTGTVSDLRVLPNDVPDLKSCLSEAFGLIQFRKFKIPRQTSTYTIRIESKAPEEEENPDDAINPPF